MVKVIDVHHESGFTLFVTFSDGTRGKADLTSELQRKAFAPLADLKVFGAAFVDFGTVCWPGGLDLAPERLYALVHELPIPDSIEDVEQNLREVSLRELRQLVGKTQAEIADALELQQSELSRFERRDERMLSTLRRYVEALGGTLEIVAVVGDKRLRLRGV